MWRRGSEQRPTVVLPSDYDMDNPAAPIYLELNEQMPGCEHFDALLLRPVALAAGEQQQADCGHPVAFPCKHKRQCRAHEEFTNFRARRLAENVATTNKNVTSQAASARVWDEANVRGERYRTRNVES